MCWAVLTSLSRATVAPTAVCTAAAAAPQSAPASPGGVASFATCQPAPTAAGPETRQCLQFSQGGRLNLSPPPPFPAFVPFLPLASSAHGTCDEAAQRCRCDAGYTGADCSEPLQLNRWYTPAAHDPVFAPRMHAAVALVPAVEVSLSIAIFLFSKLRPPPLSSFHPVHRP